MKENGEEEEVLGEGKVKENEKKKEKKKTGRQ